jgi:hypothetical protein
LIGRLDTMDFRHVRCIRTPYMSSHAGCMWMRTPSSSGWS